MGKLAGRQSPSPPLLGASLVDMQVPPTAHEPGGPGLRGVVGSWNRAEPGSGTKSSAAPEAPGKGPKLELRPNSLPRVAPPKPWEDELGGFPTAK